MHMGRSRRRRQRCHATLFVAREEVVDEGSREVAGEVLEGGRGPMWRWRRDFLGLKEIIILFPCHNITVKVDI